MPRPSLLATTARGAEEADAQPSGFALSILSAAREDARPAGGSGVLRSASHREKRLSSWLWWLGIGAVAAALLGFAQWRTGTAAPPAGPESASAPVMPVRMAQSVSLPLVAEPAAPAASASAQSGAQPIEPPASAAPGAALRELAAAPAPAAVRSVKPAPKDPDAELVAAVMAHADGARRAAEPKPLNDVQRFQFAVELRRCKARTGQTAQDACVVAACEARSYWGRTRSCPLPPEPRPARHRVAATVSPSQ